MRFTVQQNIRVGLAGLVLVLGSIACAGSSREIRKEKVAEPEKMTYGQPKLTTSVTSPTPIGRKASAIKKSTRFVHKVKWPGESLSVISKWYTGKLNHWKALAKANPKLKPHRIFVGLRIFIPKYLLKTRKPMPRSFLAKYTSRPKKKASPPKRSATKPPNKENRTSLKKPTRFLHKVTWPGETLPLIAKWYTGKSANWRAIARANRGLGRQPMVVGHKILIPEVLLKTRQPMPREFLAEPTSKPEKKAPPSKAPLPPKEEEEFELFGPKEYPNN